MAIVQFPKTPEAIWNNLLKEHEAEAGRRGAVFCNFGAVNDENSIYSKTNKAKLTTQIDPTTMEVTHNWEPYYYAPIGDSPMDRLILKEFYKTDMDTENKRRRKFADESARFVESMASKGNEQRYE